MSSGTAILFSLLSAECFAILANHETISIAIKSKRQRTLPEGHQIGRGLLRSLALELLLFVPISVALGLLIIRPLFLRTAWFASLASGSLEQQLAFYGLLGAACYGFPFVAIRQILTKVALKTLKEFASIRGTDEGEADSEPRAQGTQPKHSSST